MPIAVMAESASIAPAFLTDLITNADVGESIWTNILSRAGVSALPKRLKYVRTVGGKDVPFAAPLVPDPQASFTGERQHDENIAVIDELARSTVWKAFVAKNGVF